MLSSCVPGVVVVDIDNGLGPRWRRTGCSPDEGRVLRLRARDRRRGRVRGAPGRRRRRRRPPGGSRRAGIGGHAGPGRGRDGRGLPCTTGHDRPRPRAAGIGARGHGGARQEGIAPRSRPGTCDRRVPPPRGGRGARPRIGSDAVRFHEVGSLRSFAGVLGTALALDDLRIDRVVASALPFGRGTVDTAHGRITRPRAGHMELLRGLRVEAQEGEGELVSPTGWRSSPSRPSDPVHRPR